MTEDFIYKKSDFNHESKMIRGDSKNIYNRLRSIVDDATFVMKMADLLPGLALVANERCGSWYVDQTKKMAHSAYFKSTDGHMHIWDFNVRRNNLHLIPILMEHNGCIIVDSTRKGKRIPDALSKTVPIWCCVINRAVARYRGNNDGNWDTQFYSLPSVVSRSEHAQIESRLEDFVEKLLSSGVNIDNVSRKLKKPLRPIWYTPQSYNAISESPPDFLDAPFCPIVCLSASEAIETGYQQRTGYLYVQGSADDEESWAMGLTHNLFWKFKEQILSNATECTKIVTDIVEFSAADDDIYENCFAFIGPTTLAIGNYLSGKPPVCWDNFDCVINCGVPEYVESKECKQYLHLAIPEGKKGQIIFGASIQKAIDFVRIPLLNQKKILLYCATGRDHSVGILLSILVQYYNLELKFQPENSKPRVDKRTIQHQLVQIISYWEKAAPSRATLKRINTHFMGHS